MGEGHRRNRGTGVKSLASITWLVGESRPTGPLSIRVPAPIPPSMAGPWHGALGLPATPSRAWMQVTEARAAVLGCDL